MPERDPPDPLARLPHAGAARLPGVVLSLDPGARVEASARFAAGDPRLNELGLLPAVLLIELMAQVGGLLMPEEAAPGDYAMLAGLRKLHVHATAGADETILTAGRLVRRLGDVFLIRAECRAGTRRLAHGLLQIRRVRQERA